MTEGSRVILYLLVGGVGVFAFVFFLSLGPLGWFAAAFLVIALIAYGGRQGEDTTPDRTNCAACGSPNATDSEACDYCGAAL